MFDLPPQWIAFWSPHLYVASTASCGNEFHRLIMIFGESILSWVSCLKLANCSFYWDCFPCYEIQWKSIFLFTFLVLFMTFWGSLTVLPLVCRSSNMKIVKPFFFPLLVQKPLHTFDHPVALFFILLLLSCHFWDEMTGTVFNIQNVRWAMDFYGSIIMFSSAVFCSFS